MHTKTYISRIVKMSYNLNEESRCFLCFLINVPTKKKNNVALQLKKRDDEIVYSIRNHVHTETKI